MSSERVGPSSASEGYWGERNGRDTAESLMSASGRFATIMQLSTSKERAMAVEPASSTLEQGNYCWPEGAT